MSYMIGVDVGGTFTDFSIFNTETGNLKHFKHSSTPDDPSRAIVSGILHVLNGTTASNRSRSAIWPMERPLQRMR